MEQLSFTSLINVSSLGCTYVYVSKRAEKAAHIKSDLYRKRLGYIEPKYFEIFVQDVQDKGFLFSGPNLTLICIH